MPDVSFDRALRVSPQEAQLPIEEESARITAMAAITLGNIEHDTTGRAFDMIGDSNVRA